MATNFRGEIIPDKIHLSEIYSEMKVLADRIDQLVSNDKSNFLMEHAKFKSKRPLHLTQQVNWHLERINGKTKEDKPFNEIKGIYLLLEEENHKWKVCYVGISQTII